MRSYATTTAEAGWSGSRCSVASARWPIVGLQALDLPHQPVDFGLEDEDAPDASKVQTLGGHLRYLGDLPDLELAVAPLAARGAGRLHDLLGVEAAHERGLDPEKVGDLADAEHRRMLVVEADAHPDQPVPADAVASSRSGLLTSTVASAVVSMDVSLRGWLIGTRRGLARSATGSLRVSTPSV